MQILDQRICRIRRILRLGGIVRIAQRRRRILVTPFKLPGQYLMLRLLTRLMYAGDMAQERLSLETSLSYRLLRTAHAVQLHHQRALGGAALTLSQFWVLKLVCDGDAGRPSDAARRLGVHPGDVTRLIRGLSAKGLLTRSRRGDDQRSLHLAPTPKGEQVAAELGALIAGADAALAAAAGPDAAARLIDLLDAVHERTGGRDAGGVRPPTS
jgi:DNA-binding MarR family transcriptional regulator